MPQNVTYIATRSLTTGHVLGNPYALNLVLSAKDPQPIGQRKTQFSLSNRAFITFDHHRRRWNCRTTPRTGIDADLLREFLDSTVDQRFTFDPLNWIGTSPHDSRPVILDQGRYTERRAVQLGVDQTFDYFRFGFALREVV